MQPKDAYTLSGLLAIIPLGVYFVLWDPLFSGVGMSFYTPASESTSIMVYQGQINQFDNTTKKAKTLIDKHSRLMKSYQTLDKSVLDSTKKSIPDTVDELPFIIELQRLINKQGLDPGKISLTPASDQSSIKVLTFSFTTKGSYESIKDLISVFEQNLRFMVIRRLSITSPTVVSDPYTMTISVDVYKLR